MNLIEDFKAGDIRDCEMKKFHSEELKMLKLLTSILDENNIQYFLGFGTLLGAIRHKGFIPWDDDVDLFVPRPDYEKFKEIADRVIRFPFLVTGNILSENNQPISIKLRIENTNIQFLSEKNGLEIKENMWIDIFPIDGLPESKVVQKLLFIKFRILYIGLRLGRATMIGVQESKKRSVIEYCGVELNRIFKIGRFIDTKKIVEKIDSIRMKYNYNDSKYVCAFTIEYMEKGICKREWFGKGIKGKFEREEFKIPDNSDAILKQIYGNYLVMPPLEHRTLKHGIKIVEQ